MAKGYEILRIDELTRMSDTGGLERYSRVRFKTTGGVVKTLDIDELDLTPEKVAPVVEKRAKELDAILAL